MQGVGKTDPSLLEAGVFLLPLLSLAQAGGAHDTWMVTSATEQDGVPVFTLRHADDGYLNLDDCDEITVEVRYGLRPWYRTFFTDPTSFPTRAQTDLAVAYLQRMHRLEEPAAWGMMGSGVGDTDTPCVYESRGMILYSIDDEPAAYSFYNPI